MTTTPQPAPPAWRYSPHASFVLPTDARRHVGFSLRISVGLGLAWASRELARGESEVSGPNAVLNVDIGAAAIENLILYGRIGGFAFDHAFSGDSDNAGSAFFGTFGVGARYHFMPHDFYASGTLSLAAVSVTDDLGNAQNGGVGFGFDVEAGKNWWAGSYRERWCVGLGLRFAYAVSGSVEPRRGERGEDPWTGTSLSLVFSTAYN